MAYSFVYINPLRQFGEYNCTLIITDSDGIMPDVRIDKTFKDSVSEDELSAEADREILRALDTWSNN